MANEKAGGTTAPSITQIVTSQDRWYVNFLSGVDGDHNNHAVIAWIVTSDNKTMLPMISSPLDQKSIVAANMISDDYVILNPYNQCPACVRPVEPVADPLAKVQQDLHDQRTHSIPKGFA